MPRYAVFKVQRAKRLSATVKVNYQTQADTAVEGTDFQPTSGTLVFAPGEIEKEVRVEIRSTPSSTAVRFALRLSSPVQGVLGRTVGYAVIPAVVVDDPLQAMLPNRDLTVLFYAGEKHPDPGVDPGELSDSEWTLAAGYATQDDTDGNPTDTPFPGYVGQFLINAGPFVVRGATGPIATLSGWYLHYLVVGAPDDGSMMNMIFTNQLVLPPDYSLDPATKDSFNAWWDENCANKSILLLDADGNTIRTATLPGTTAEMENDSAGSSASARTAAIINFGWPPDDLTYGHTLRIQ